MQPFGPSAPIRDLHVGNARYDDKIEKAYYDTDLRATQAVVELYNRGVMVSKIQKAFSVGAFGVEKKRRLVPTRWSITAVDDIISKNLREKVKTFPEINEYRVYESIYMDNVFEILMIPAQWSYESMEAWYPGTVWNPNGTSISIFSDWEGNSGRTTYAQIGGCYYSARLAVCEQLAKRTTPSHRHRSARSPTRLHHAHRRLASPRKRSKRHAPKTLPVQEPCRIAPVYQRQI